ncbi:MAG: RHS repeat-associated core domain-containing protein [Candidatus Obscuribacter sp.]|nr:RHS repeat-associated core domain-containing protein [Candidatus Obscuribacter sp.]
MFTVDGNANLTAVVDPNLKTYSYVYDQPGRMTQIFQPNSAVVAYNTNVYDSLSRVKSQKNALNQESFFYLAGSRAEVIDPLGHSVIYYYNRFSRVLRAINALGFETKYEYDGLQRLTKATMPELNEVRYTYDSFNNVMSQTLVPKPGSLLANLSTSFTYDPVWKKVKTSVDAKGQTTTFNYDPSTGNLLSIVRPNVGGFSPTTSMTWNARGQVLTATDPSGVLTQFSYDLATEKLLSIVVDPGISPHLALTTSYGYDTVGNVTSVTNPNLNQSTFLYDSLRRRTQITSPAPFNFVTKYVFDDNSNLLNIQRQTGGLPMFQQTDYTYSATNQLLTVTDSSGNSLTHTYDGKDRLATVSDAQSRVVQFGYDALDRRYQVTDPNLVVSSVLTFSNNGLLATSADARSNVTQYLYDGFGRIDKVIYPDTTFIQNQTYDANGNVLTHVTRAGNNVIVTYDALDRISTVTPQSQPQVSYIYDLAGRLTQASKPTVAGDPSSGALQYFFDTAGRFFKEQYPDGKTVTHLLDANGNWIKTTWPDGYFIERVFDQLDRLTDIKLNGAVTAAAHFDYNQLSQRIATTFGNGTSVSYDREIDGTLPSLTHNFVGSSVTFSYGYNSDYELTGQQMTDLSYLWRPTPAGTISYGTASANDTYPTVGGVAQSYNGNKCLTGDGVWTYVYDTENHLISASKVGVTASFVYDPSNRQSQKTVGSVKSRYVYSGWQRIADYDGTTDSLQTRYIYGSGLDEPLIQVSSTGVPTYLHHDRMGTVIGVSNAAGMIVNKSKIGPFGEVGAMAGTNFGLTGQRYDSELGLYYYKNRYYSPTLGRFLQPDPIGTAGGANLYAYVGNAPFNFTDPLGLDPRDPNDEDYDGYNINDYNGGDATVGEKIELEDDGSESSPGDTQRSGGGGGGGGAPWLFPPAEAYPGGHPNNLDPATRHPKSTYGDRYTSVEHTGKAAGKRTIIVNPKAFADPSTTGAIGLGKDYVGKTQQRTPKGNINPLGRSPDHFTEGRNTGNKEVIIPTKEPNVKKVEQGFINKYRARPSVDKFGRPMPKLTNTRNPWPNASSAAAGFAYMWLEYVLNAQTDHPAY